MTQVMRHAENLLSGAIERPRRSPGRRRGRCRARMTSSAACGRERGPVRPIARERVEDVRDGDDATLERDVGAGEAGADSRCRPSARDASRRWSPRARATRCPSRRAGRDRPRCAVPSSGARPSVSSPVLRRTASGIAILPMSCSGAARRSSSTLRLVEAELGCDRGGVRCRRARDALPSRRRGTRRRGSGGSAFPHTRAAARVRPPSGARPRAGGGAGRSRCRSSTRSARTASSRSRRRRASARPRRRSGSSWPVTITVAMSGRVRTSSSSSSRPELPPRPMSQSTTENDSSPSKLTAPRRRCRRPTQSWPAAPTRRAISRAPATSSSTQSTRVGSVMQSPGGVRRRALRVRRASAAPAQTASSSSSPCDGRLARARCARTRT